MKQRCSASGHTHARAGALFPGNAQLSVGVVLRQDGESTSGGDRQRDQVQDRLIDSWHRHPPIDSVPAALRERSTEKLAPHRGGLPVNDVLRYGIQIADAMAHAHSRGILACGVMLYELASGRPPFAGATPREILDAVVHAEPEPLSRVRRDLSSALSIVVHKALAKDPSRYPRMSELATTQMPSWSRRVPVSLLHSPL